MVQDKLKMKGIKHSLTMDIRHIYSEYISEEFKSALEDYYRGTTNRENTIKRLLEDL
jgi:hypothetical protein